MSIDDYDIGQLLGRGGFANVYRARSRLKGEVVAIKIIEKIKIDELKMNDRIENEIRIHSNLKHPNIIKLHSYFEDQSNIYMVLEPCSHGNLYSYLKKREKLSEKDAGFIVFQILNAVSYLHSLRIVHRDLKLSNIILNENMTVKLCDFGLAIQFLHPDEEHYTICGTPNYIAPEVASQQSHGTPADLWSIGCLFYSLVTGEMPFDPMHNYNNTDNKQKRTNQTHIHSSSNNQDDNRLNHQNNIKSILEKIVLGIYPKPTEISHEALDFLESLLDVNPVSRPSASDVLRHSFLIKYHKVTHNESSKGRHNHNHHNHHRHHRHLEVQSQVTQEKKALKQQIHHDQQHLQHLQQQQQHSSSITHQTDNLTRTPVSSDSFIEPNNPTNSNIYPKLCEEPIEFKTTKSSSSSKLGKDSGLMLYSSQEIRESFSRFKDNESSFFDDDDVGDDKFLNFGAAAADNNKSDEPHLQYDNTRDCLKINGSNDYLSSILKFRDFLSHNNNCNNNNYNQLHLRSNESISRLTIPTISLSLSLSLSEGSSFLGIESPKSPSLHSGHKTTQQQQQQQQQQQPLLSSWVDPVLAPFVYKNKSNDVLLVSNNGDVLFYTNVKIKNASSPILSTQKTDHNHNHNHDRDHDNNKNINHSGYRKKLHSSSLLSNLDITNTTSSEATTLSSSSSSYSKKAIRLCVRKSEPFVLYLGEVNEIMQQEIEKLEIQNQSTLFIEKNNFDFGNDFCHIFGPSLWKKSYSLVKKELPANIMLIYTTVKSMLQETKAQIPSLVLYMSVAQPPPTSESSSVSQTGIYCKCMLMANDPLPDFRIQWSDQTKLRYSLHNGRLFISNPKFGKYQRDGQDGILWATAPKNIRSYLLIAQDFMRICLDKHSDLKRGVNSTRKALKDVNIFFESILPSELDAIQNQKHLLTTTGAH